MVTPCALSECGMSQQPTLGCRLFTVLFVMPILRTDELWVEANHLLVGATITGSWGTVKIGHTAVFMDAMCVHWSQ